MTSSGSYDVNQSHRDADSEVQRLAAQARLGWEKEARTLAWFGLKDGVSVLEAGSGPGFVTEALLTFLPTSPITCLELDPALLSRAQHYLSGTANGRLQLVAGSVMDTKFADNSFDFGYARLLFQHLPDPVGAAREMLRVLKPGGKFVIYDVDDAVGNLFEPPIPEMPVIVEKYGQAQAAQGGNRNIGRKLWRILTSAGFKNLDLELIAEHSDDVGIESFLPQIDPDRLLPLVQFGLMTEAELEAIRASRANFLASPNPFILTVSFMVCGTKP